MTTATPYPDGDEAPADLFESRDCDLAFNTAGSVLNLVQAALREPDAEA